MSDYRDERDARYLRCGQCNRPVIDDTTDFGNGLMLRSTCGGVEFRIMRSQGEGMVGQDWTPGISRDDLLAFLGVR